MTTTLVLGNPQSGRSRHAESLLSAHPAVTLVNTRQRAEGEDHKDQLFPEGRAIKAPEHWTVLETHDLTRALLNSRNPVLIDNLPDWVTSVLDERGLWGEPTLAREAIDELVDELCVALSAVPFETVTITSESTGGGTHKRQLLLDHLLARVNARVAGASNYVHAVLVGRVLDLSDAPQVGQV